MTEQVFSESYVLQLQKQLAAVTQERDLYVHAITLIKKYPRIWEEIHGQSKVTSLLNADDEEDIRDIENARAGVRPLIGRKP